MDKTKKSRKSYLFTPYGLKQAMTTAAHILTILGILCMPMITIGALVLVLAAFNTSLGVRRLYVRLLAITFDYATKIKKDKEHANDRDNSTIEPSTPELKKKRKSNLI